jgi:hypothetical protein
VTVPVFTDTSGQRRRLMRVIGASVSVLCVGALVVLAIALAGGPSSPFPLWAQNPARNQAHKGSSVSHGGHGRAAPGAARQIQPSGLIGPPGHSTSPSASPTPGTTSSSTASPSPSPSPSKTPPGRYHSKSPHPHPSHSH